MTNTIYGSDSQNHNGDMEGIGMIKEDSQGTV
jgi:hypothetical protein